MAIPEDDYNQAFLSELVDQRREEPDIEYKAWMNLSESEGKAKIAKHICAIANYGGGWLVFGIDDNGKHSEPHPGDLSAYNHDVVNGIVSRYLAPAFHCSVYPARSKLTGKTYPAVRIPPHGTTPICAKANGPLVGKSIVGIIQGTHYLRVPGPRSEPINTPDLWRELIHRCVVNERESLLASIGRLFDRPEASDTSNALDSLLDEASDRWKKIVPPSGWPVDAKVNRAVFAFRLLNGNGELPAALSLQKLTHSLREASNVADAAVDQGWTFFLQAGRENHKPKVRLFGEVEGYEAVMVASNGGYTTVPALWCASIDGSGFEVRLHREDSQWVTSAVNDQSSRKWVPGASLAPRMQAALMLQFVIFVRALASHFPDAERIELAADYIGLSGRKIDDPNPSIHYSVERKSVTDQRRVKLKMSVEALAGDDGAAEAAAELLAPIFRLFDGWQITPEFVSRTRRDRSNR
jgi:hypothetical protein